MKSNIILLIFLFSTQATSFLIGKSYEVRAYIKDIQESKKILGSLGAEYKGDYLCTEYVYAVNAQNVDLDNEFIRLRDYARTNWNQKRFCFVHKKMELPDLTRRVVYSHECDTLAEAQEVVKEYALLCSYSRQGWEYHVNGMKIYIEDIQGINPSIEIIGQDRAIIDALLKQLSVEEVVSHSLPYLVYEAKKLD